MKKIPTIFDRDWNGNKSLVTAQPNPACDWVFAGEGVATRKFDGTACMVKDGVLFKRYDARVQPRPRFNQETKKVQAKQPSPPPPDFIPAQEPDYESGHWPGWVPVGDGPVDFAHREGFSFLAGQDRFPVTDGTYELLGPKVQGNPDGFAGHQLVMHGGFLLPDAPRDFDGLKAYLEANAMEGIVWHHSDGRMAKIKARDLGLRWPR